MTIPNSQKFLGKLTKTFRKNSGKLAGNTNARFMKNVSNS